MGVVVGARRVDRGTARLRLVVQPGGQAPAPGDPEPPRSRRSPRSCSATRSWRPSRSKGAIARDAGDRLLLRRHAPGDGGPVRLPIRPRRATSASTPRRSSCRSSCRRSSSSRCWAWSPTSTPPAPWPAPKLMVYLVAFQNGFFWRAFFVSAPDGSGSRLQASAGRRPPPPCRRRDGRSGRDRAGGRARSRGTASRRTACAGSPANACSSSARVFITNGPCCATGSPMGRPCSSRISTGPSTASIGTGWSACTRMAAGHGTTRSPTCSAVPGNTCSVRSGGRRRAPAAPSTRRRPRARSTRSPRRLRAARPTSWAAAPAAPAPSSAPAITVTIAVRAAGVALDRARDVLVPEHREVGRHQLVARRQVQPDLKQLERVRAVGDRAAGTSPSARRRRRPSATARRPCRTAPSRRASRSDRCSRCARWSRSRSRGADAAGNPGTTSP